MNGRPVLVRTATYLHLVIFFLLVRWEASCRMLGDAAAFGYLNYQDA